MNEEQMLPAFIAKLIQEQDVSPWQIQYAINGVENIKLGQTIINDDDPLVHAFAHEQADRLRKACSQ
jgi:hypothetical protein